MTLEKGDVLYYVRSVGGDKTLMKVTVRTVYENELVIVNETKIGAFPISWKLIDEVLHKNRSDALEYYNSI